MRSILQRPVQLPDVSDLVRRSEHALVHESQQDFALLVVLDIGEEISQDLSTSPRLVDAPSSLDPSLSSCGCKIAPILVSGTVGTTSLV